ncbi:hypothetical protein Bca52824_012843 [Brassica carinata]|uniref:Uncharacterized protein n=1 Tax=Brassica carinata TaxID=52824 RepID=A0A8X8B1Y7_BRACI|nr:hypothetical protein Bca52824_012843 [Brassica carinata]
MCTEPCGVPENRLEPSSFMAHGTHGPSSSSAQPAESSGIVQCTGSGHVSLIRTCTDKSHVQSKGQNMKVKGQLCDHVETVGNIGTWSIAYPIAPLPNLSSFTI